MKLEIWSKGYTDISTWQRMTWSYGKINEKIFSCVRKLTLQSISMSFFQIIWYNIYADILHLQSFTTWPMSPLQASPLILQKHQPSYISPSMPFSSHLHFFQHAFLSIWSVLPYFLWWLKSIYFFITKVKFHTLIATLSHKKTILKSTLKHF